MVDTSVLDKSMRSVFVGNIPYETTEEKLKDIFSAVGQVLSFKLVFDRENGKPKGYGFCEYKDQETALSAMRNLNGYEIAGRSLRVDNACTEKSRLEMQSLMAGPPVDNTYGEPVDSEKAPEAISKAVASLPPEQMFELMKQMKLCIQNNPQEGRQMLLQNPQLAYALLQAQVVMRIVDPQVAVTMLHKVNPSSNVAMPPPQPASVPQAQPMPPPMMQTVPIPPQPLMQQPMPQPMPPPMQPPMQPMPPKPMDQGIVPPPRLPNHPVNMPVPGPQPLLPPQGQDMDLRTMNRMAPPRGVGPAVGPSPLMPPMGGPMGPGQMGPGLPPGPPLSGDQDMRIPPNPIPPPSADIVIMDTNIECLPPLPVEKPVESNSARDPRGMYARDPRGVAVPPPQPPPAVKPVFPAASAVAAASSPSQSASDQEKAALIMQVLQLSDDQISMLPPEQRQSIIVLKEQIAKSTQQR